MRNQHFKWGAQGLYAYWRQTTLEWDFRNFRFGFGWFPALFAQQVESFRIVDKLSWLLSIQS
jgi:hypothetical protein